MKNKLKLLFVILLVLTIYPLTKFIIYNQHSNTLANNKNKFDLICSLAIKKEKKFSIRKLNNDSYQFFLSDVKDSGINKFDFVNLSSLKKTLQQNGFSEIDSVFFIFNLNSLSYNNNKVYFEFKNKNFIYSSTPIIENKLIEKLTDGYYFSCDNLR